MNVVLLAAIDHEHTLGEHVPVTEVPHHFFEQSRLSDPLLSDDVERQDVAIFASALIEPDIVLFAAANGESLVNY